MKLELILRKYESSRINPSREFRCFVRNDILLGAPSLSSGVVEKLELTNRSQREGFQFLSPFPGCPSPGEGSRDFEVVL